MTATITKRSCFVAELIRDRCTPSVAIALPEFDERSHNAATLPRALVALITSSR
jgi:hypothetical protein